MKNLMISATIATALLGTPAIAQDMTPAGYVAKAGASDLYELTASKLVLASTKNPKLREFAQMMITDHTKSTAAVKAAAAKSHLVVAPPKLMPQQKEMVAELRADQGTARDAAYITQQKAAHEQALDLQKNYAMSGTAPALKSTAAMIVPVVEQHIAMLQAM